MTDTTSIFQKEETDQDQKIDQEQETNQNQEINQEQGGLFEVLPLFPTPVLIKRYTEDLTEEIKYAKVIDYGRDNMQQVGGNSQSTDSFILNKKELSNIKTFIEASIKEYCEKILECEDELRITQSWINKSTFGQSHHLHNHPNSIISGVFYFQSDEKTAPIQFRKASDSSFNLIHKKYNHFTTEMFNLYTTSGDLILFPSNLFHTVLPNQSTSERLSLSFNTFVTQSTGSIKSLTYLPLGDTDNA